MAAPRNKRHPGNRASQNTKARSAALRAFTNKISLRLLRHRRKQTRVHQRLKLLVIAFEVQLEIRSCRNRRSHSMAIFSTGVAVISVKDSGLHQGGNRGRGHRIRGHHVQIELDAAREFHAVTRAETRFFTVS